MGIRKVVKIRNVGRLADCLARGNVEFGSYTLVFAENGRGKTTLCAVLRSLQSGDVAHVVGRKTLGSDAPQEIKILSNAGTHHFRQGNWNSTMPSLAIFDSTFVSDNVYVGDVVDTEQRRNLYQFIIGDENVRLARRIDELDRLIRQQNRILREKRQEIERHIPTGVTFDEFLRLAELPDVVGVITAKKEEVEAAKASEAIAEGKALSEALLPGLPANLNEILRQGLEEVAARAEDTVIEHMRRHKMRPNGEAWISEGLGHIEEDACPFCGQDISGIPLIDAFKTYFSGAYESLRQEVVSVEREIDEVLGETALARFESVVSQNAVLVQFWNQHCRFDPLITLDVAQVRRVLTTLRRAVSELLTQKRSALLTAMTPSKDMSEAQDSYERLRRVVDGYNSSVFAVNKSIESCKKQARTINLAQALKELALLSAHQMRYREEVKGLCEEYLTADANKIRSDEEKARLRRQLDDQTSQLMVDYEECINYYLERFNAGFRITGTQHTYRGGSPSTVYQILINNVPVELGNRDSPLDQPTFKNTLSSGDRSTLALAFFFARIEHDPLRSEKVVVLDDPFTSQDSFRRNQTVFQIKQLGRACAQVVVLSHDMRFLHLLWERLRPEDRTALKLSRIGVANTTIQPWDIVEALQGRHQRDVIVLQEFSAGEGDPGHVVQRIRPLLEAFCRGIYPHLFSDEEMLGDIVRKVRESEPTHPLFDIVEDLEELNEYTRRYHHGEDVGKAAEPIVDEELHGYVKRTLGIVGAAV